MTPDLELQKALRAALVGNAAVISLVPPSAILDRISRPAPRLAIVLGESQTLDLGGAVKGDQVEITHTIHVWQESVSLVGVKEISGAIRRAIRSGRVKLGGGYHLAGWSVSAARHFADPDGVSAHGVLTIHATICGGDL